MIEYKGKRLHQQNDQARFTKSSDFMQQPPSTIMLAFKRFFTSEAGPSKPDPAGTAIRLIRGLLEKHERLSTPQIWEKGTEGFKPILQPVQEYNEKGDIKMKIVSNMREGRRVWVPPPILPMPHHPFQSVK
jgi:hypothetical protein